MALEIININSEKVSSFKKLVFNILLTWNLVQINYGLHNKHLQNSLFSAVIHLLLWIRYCLGLVFHFLRGPWWRGERWQRISWFRMKQMIFKELKATHRAVYSLRQGRLSLQYPRFQRLQSLFCSSVVSIFFHTQPTDQKHGRWKKTYIW